MWSLDHGPLVEYGVARFVGGTSVEISVDEPVALVGIMRYLETNVHTLEGNTTIHLHSGNPGLALEEAVLLALTRPLQNTSGSIE
jgi:hypothetical protein